MDGRSDGGAGGRAGGRYHYGLSTSATAAEEQEGKLQRKIDLFMASVDRHDVVLPFHCAPMPRLPVQTAVMVAAVA